MLMKKLLPKSDNIASKIKVIFDQFKIFDDAQCSF